MTQLPIARRAFAHVDVIDDIARAEGVWRNLEEVAPHSAYQRFDWAATWLETIGVARGVSAAIVVARDSEGRPLALLPFGVERRGPLRLAEFLGYRDANYTFGLFRADHAFDADDLCSLLTTAGRRAGIDLFALVNQPLIWEGAHNPFASLPHQASPSMSYKARIGEDGAAYLTARLSKETRKKLRRKEEKLSELGVVTHVAAQDSATARRILDAFQAQKSFLLQNKGVGSMVSSPAADAFLERTAITPLAARAEPIVQAHALFCGERIVATLAGARAGSHFSGMFNSYDPDARIARFSPGDLLLTKLIPWLSAAGCLSFDLGVGEARYKTTFCDTPDPLFDVYLAVTPGGRALEIVKSAKRTIKRRVKQSPLIWRVVEMARRASAGLQAARR